MKLLLHVCCGPCALYPWQKLTGDEGVEVAGFFYNPNIHPAAEYLARRKAVERFSAESGCPVHWGEYDIENFFRAVCGRETEDVRCPVCWELRLRKTAEFARQNGFPTFSTTLLVSPYQSQEKIKAIGDRVAGEVGVSFLYRDFRPGFKWAHEEARQRGYYLQKYCGCVYSERERLRKKLT